MDDGHLPSAIPQIQHEVAHELDVAVFDINGSAQSANVFCNIVAENDASHGRLASTALAHQQHLPLLLTLLRVHRVRVFDRQLGSGNSSEPS